MQVLVCVHNILDKWKIGGTGGSNSGFGDSFSVIVGHGAERGGIAGGGGIRWGTEGALAGLFDGALESDEEELILEVVEIGIRSNWYRRGGATAASAVIGIYGRRVFIYKIWIIVSGWLLEVTIIIKLIHEITPKPWGACSDLAGAKGTIRQNT